MLRATNSQPTLDPDGIKRRAAVRTLSILLGLMYVYVAIALWVFAFITHNYFLVFVHLVTAIVATVVLIYINLRQSVDAGITVLSYLAAWTIVPVILSGGFYGTGLFIMMPVFLFYMTLMKPGPGLRMVLGVFGIFAIAYALDLGQLIHLVYNPVQFGVFLFCYALAVIFFVLYSRQKAQLDDQLQSLLERNQQLLTELKRDKAEIERQVQNRTRELSDAQAELTASIRSLPFGFALINSRGHIVLANDHLAALLRHPGAAYEGELNVDEIHNTLLPKLRLKQLLAQVHAKRQVSERKFEHGQFFFRLRCTPIIDAHDHTIGVVLILEDTTAQHALERSRDEFFSIASHELRTPLTAIRGNTDMVLGYYASQLKDPDLKAMLDDIHTASIRLITIVNDFLDTSRLELGKIQFKPTDFDVTSVIASVLREYTVTSSRKKLHLLLQDPPTSLPLVHADIDRVRQILINLISNSLKFTHEGGITITPSLNGHFIKIAVSDTGRGISPETRHLLFRKFQQATQSILTRDNTHGTGLGLYISRLLAEGMHGHLYLESTEIGKGSTFALELPLS